MASTASGANPAAATLARRRSAWEPQSIHTASPSPQSSRYASASLSAVKPGPPTTHSPVASSVGVVVADICPRFRRRAGRLERAGRPRVRAGGLLQHHHELARDAVVLHVAVCLG